MRPLGIWLLVPWGYLASGCAEGSGSLAHARPVPPGTDGGPSPTAESFVHRQGTELVAGDGEPFRLRGVTFSSYYFGPTRDSIIHSKDHAAQDFTRVADLGMNVVQLILSYRAFEDDAAPFAYRDEGWAWLDDNVEQARANGLGVVLDLLLLAGGDWHDMTKPADFRVWTDDTLRRRYVELWRAIAERYADQPTVMAYSLLNEPVTTDTDGSSWWSLAREAIGAIRAVDSRHLIILDPLAGVNGSYGVPADVPSRILFDDDNLLYDIHCYEPAEYVNQGASWMPGVAADGGRYPDDTIVTAAGTLDWVSGDAANPTLPAGDSDWALYEGAVYRVTDSRAVVAYPAVQCSPMTAEGAAYFDDFVVREYDPNGVLLRVVGEGRVTEANAGAWYPWSSDGQAILEVAAGEGHADPYALSVSGDSATALFSTRLVLFMVTTGHAYQISGWAKGKNLDPGARCQYTLGFYQPGPDGSMTFRGRGLLSDLMTRRLAFGQANGVPMAVTEFGLMRSCFDDGRGGIAWLTDMVSVLDEHELGYVFFTYNSVYMGIYGDENELPNPTTELTPITDFFRATLGGKATP